MERAYFKDLDLSSTCFKDLCDFFDRESIERLGREVKFVERRHLSFECLDVFTIEHLLNQ
jgi:hypothetical protein